MKSLFVGVLRQLVVFLRLLYAYYVHVVQTQVEIAADLHLVDHSKICGLCRFGKVIHAARRISPVRSVLPRATPNRMCEKRATTVNGG